MRPSQRLEQLHAIPAESFEKTTRGPHCTTGSRNIREPKISRIHFRRKLLTKAVRQGSTTPWTRDTKIQGSHTSKSSPRRDRSALWTKVERSRRTSSSTTRSTAASSASTRSPGSTKNIRIRDLAETYGRFCGAVTHIPSKRMLVTVPWKKTKSTWIAKDIAKDSALHETRCVIEEQVTRTKWHLAPTLGHPKERELGKMTSSIVQCQQCNMDKVVGTFFRACGAKLPNLSTEQEQHAQTSLQEGFACIRDHTQLEMRPRKLRGNISGQKRAQQQ